MSSSATAQAADAARPEGAGARTGAQTPGGASGAQRPEAAEFDDWCLRLTGRIRGLVEALILQAGEDGALRVIGASSGAAGAAPRAAYAGALAKLAEAGAPVLMPLDREEDGIAEVIALPLAEQGGRLVGLFGLAAMPARQAELVMEHVQASAGWVAYMAGRQGLARAQAMADVQRTGFNLLAEMLDAGDADGSAQVLCSQLAERLGCERVSLVRRTWRGKPRLMAVSGLSQFDRRMRVNDLTEQAADEAFLRREPILWQRGETPGQVAATLAEYHDDEAVAAIPLVDARGRAAHALVLQWPRGTKTPDLQRFDPLWILACPVLSLHRAADRGVPGRIGIAALLLFRRVFGTGHPVLKAVTLALVVVLGLLVFVDGPRVLRAQTTIDDPGLRVVAAPTEGYLRELHVMPGDDVREGQILARLDDSDLQLRLAEIDAQLARHLAEEALARRDRRPADAAVAAAEAEEARARIALVRREIDRMAIVATVTGRVLEGDLRQRIGGKVQRGEALMQIAPRGAVEVRVAVPNRDARLLEAGLSGTLRLKAAPLDPLRITVERVNPAAEMIDGELSFVGFARLDASALRLENGMQGVARLSLGEAPLWRIWILPVVERLYVFAWRWMP